MVLALRDPRHRVHEGDRLRVVGKAERLRDRAAGERPSRQAPRGARARSAAGKRARAGLAAPRGQAARARLRSSWRELVELEVEVGGDVLLLLGEVALAEVRVAGLHLREELAPASSRGARRACTSGPDRPRNSGRVTARRNRARRAPSRPSRRRPRTARAAFARMRRAAAMRPAEGDRRRQRMMACRGMRWPRSGRRAAARCAAPPADANRRTPNRADPASASTALSSYSLTSACDERSRPTRCARRRRRPRTRGGASRATTAARART